MVNPDDLYVNTEPPSVHIEAIRADFRDRPFSQSMRLPPLTRDIEIDHSALSFAAPQKIQFRYKLLGFDPNWHDVGTRRQAVYMNLKPGTYRFQVIASNNDGVWNMAGDSFSFTIPPRFYQTEWFLALIVLAVLALIYATFMVRLRVSTRLVEGRMHARLLERDRIARELHDTLLQGFQGIVLRLQGVARTMSECEPSKVALEDTMDRADQVLIDGRQSLLQLRSGANGSRGLAGQLNDVITDLQLQKDVPCALSIIGQECALKPTVHEEIFAFAREALTNAFRHSNAASIVAELNYTKAHFSFRCIDNGVGLPAAVMDARSAEGHWGLVGLRERAANLHAQFNLRSNHPHGTIVEVVLRARIAYPGQRLRRLRRLIPGLAE
jgi:signal transduction histidine kinase